MGAWAAEPVPSTVVPQGRGEAGRRSACSFPQCFGISLCPLSVYPSSQSPFCPQDHYRKFCPTSVYVSSSEASRTSEKIILQPCCPGNFWSAASFVSFLKSLPIPSLCLLYQTPHSPSLPGSLHHSPSLQTLVQKPLVLVTQQSCMDLAPLIFSGKLIPQARSLLTLLSPNLFPLQFADASAVLLSPAPDKMSYITRLFASGGTVTLHFFGAFLQKSQSPQPASCSHNCVLCGYFRGHFTP